MAPHSLAPTIHTLSLSSNQIRAFPLEAIEALTSLTWFKLRGNYIETIPEKPFRYGNEQFEKIFEPCFKKYFL